MYLSNTSIADAYVYTAVHQYLVSWYAQQQQCILSTRTSISYLVLYKQFRNSLLLTDRDCNVRCYLRGAKRGSLDVAVAVLL